MNVIFWLLIICSIIYLSISHEIHVKEGVIDLSDEDQHVFVIKDLGGKLKSTEDFLHFARTFGNIDKAISGTPPYIINNNLEHCIEPTEYYTSIVEEPGDDNHFWHSDLSYLAVPPNFSIVRAIELPYNKTKTIFKDMKMVFDDFPNNERLIGIMANHSDNFNTSNIHSVVRGDRLFVNKVFTRSIIGYENNILLNEILTFIDNHKESEIIIEWEIDDILIWDNNFVFHYDYPEEELRREIQRVIIY
jgi:alpha-ketoglutarate-dependent taurine dioxygenase